MGLTLTMGRVGCADRVCKAVSAEDSVEDSVQDVVSVEAMEPSAVDGMMLLLLLRVMEGAVLTGLFVSVVATLGSVVKGLPRGEAKAWVCMSEGVWTRHLSCKQAGSMGRVRVGVTPNVVGKVATLRGCPQLAGGM